MSKEEEKARRREGKKEGKKEGIRRVSGIKASRGECRARVVPLQILGSPYVSATPSWRGTVISPLR